MKLLKGIRDIPRILASLCLALIGIYVTWAASINVLSYAIVLVIVAIFLFAMAYLVYTKKNHMAISLVKGTLIFAIIMTTLLIIYAIVTTHPSAPDLTIRHASGFGNYTFDGQDEVTATVKKATDPYHMVPMKELTIEYGYAKDGASYSLTSTGKNLHAYVDYSMDGYVVVLQPKRSSLTKREFMAIVGTFHRVD